MMPTLFGKVEKTGAINASQILTTPLKELALPRPPWLVAPKTLKPTTPSLKNTVQSVSPITC